LFGDEERIEMLKESLRKYPNVKVDRFDGLLVEFAHKKKVIAIVRGLRAVSDFEYEFQMALTNRKLDNNISTVFLMPHEKYTYLNSSIVREIAMHGGDVSEFVPKNVVRRLKEKFTPFSKDTFN
jgi:pantetheine-phosphate adenylyltransferase